jgi:hypothetical protein
MSLSDAATIANIINTVVVTLTLVVLIISIRQNTQSQKVVAVQSLTAAITAINVPAMESPALGSALLSATRDWAGAERNERIVAHYFLFCYFKLAEQAWFQHKAKVLDEAQWFGWENGVRMFYHSPGVRDFWWPRRRSAYALEFQTHLAASAPPDAGMGNMSQIFDPPPAAGSTTSA